MSDGEEETKYTLAMPDVVTKYMAAAEIANDAIKEVTKALKPGVRIVEICQLGDDYILKRTSAVYNKSKKVDKGIAFPTCLSVNNVVGHFSPFADHSATRRIMGRKKKQTLSFPPIANSSSSPTSPLPPGSIGAGPP